MSLHRVCCCAPEGPGPFEMCPIQSDCDAPNFNLCPDPYLVTVSGLALRWLDVSPASGLCVNEGEIILHNWQTEAFQVPPNVAQCFWLPDEVFPIPCPNPGSTPENHFYGWDIECFWNPPVLVVPRYRITLIGSNQQNLGPFGSYTVIYEAPVFATACPPEGTWSFLSFSTDLDNGEPLWELINQGNCSVIA